MQKLIDRGACPRVHPKQFAIQHQRDPGERKPIAGVERGERPADARGGDSRGYARILGDIVGIVKKKKRVPGDRTVDCEYRGGKRCASP